MFCKNCGDIVTKGEKFCDKCGKLVEGESPTSTTTGSTYTTATSNKRLINFIIDVFVGYVFASILVVLFELSTSEDILGFLFPTCIGLYYLITESVFQKSLGKLITKTKVVNIEGKKPTFSQILGRSLARFIPLDAFSYIGTHPIGWHDKLSKTLVVPDNYSEEDVKQINTENVKSQENKSIKVFLIILGSIILIGILSSVILASLNSARQRSQNVDEVTNENILPTIQNKIAASVVNILCSDGTENGAVGSGSGTIITSDGGILTNSHVIPQDKEGTPLPKLCAVTLPNPITGQIEGVYYASPIIVPILSEQYDLAYLQIEGVHTDEDGVRHGEYPRTFPTYETAEACKTPVVLGESVRIFGYPTIGGGYSLTVTDGIVSGFPEEGFIMTSAKTSFGNSGGLAVDKDGCFVGVPSMVSIDEGDSLGVIISPEAIQKFEKKVEALQTLIE